MFFRCFFCTVRLSIFERFVFASFEPLRFCKKVRFVFPDLFYVFLRVYRRYNSMLPLPLSPSPQSILPGISMVTSLLSMVML